MFVHAGRPREDQEANVIKTGGRSGAWVHAVKRAEQPNVLERLRNQWLWLQTPRERNVQVFDWLGDGYEMELLEPCYDDLPTRLAIIGEILEDEVWTRWEEPPDWEHHLEVIKARGAPRWLVDLGRRLGGPIGCVAHGDPTAENLMQRPNGQRVLIDPVPDASCGTNERAADMGKMLQSAVGYELLRTGQTTHLDINPAAVDVVRTLATDAWEWSRARYWLGVWLVMIRKYQTAEVAAQLATDIKTLHPFIEGRPGAFLDRDGTLNATVKGVPPRGDEEVRLLDGVEDACRLLREAGYEIVIISNQPEIARGTLSRADVARANSIVQRATGATVVQVCPHDPKVETCECRKPAPGLILSAAKMLNLDLTRSFVVGDKDVDVEAGDAARLWDTFLVDTDTAYELLEVVKEGVL